ncbi:MAG: hypothetical protein RJA70_4915 [Pseudomonadota bacterium]|jgi:hypothetical protein
MKSPLSVVKERFGDKQKLVAAVEKLAVGDLWIDRLSDKELARVSNTKLLKLHDVLSTATKDFGSRAKLVSAILELEKRTKDDGLKARLESYPLPRLADAHAAARKRAAKAKAAPAPVATEKKRVARTKKAKAKASA